MANNGDTPSNLLPVPKWTFIIHGAQGVLALIILSLDAYGIHWIAYNALIFSLVACILTLAAVAYGLATQIFLTGLYNKFIWLGLHLLMLIFWIVDLGLVANLARIWAGAGCGYSYYYGYYCSYGWKRSVDYYEMGSSGLVKREDTTVGAYYGALAAGAFFAAMQFALWGVSFVILVMYLNKERTGSNATTTTTTPAPQQPNYAADQAIPLGQEKYGQTGQPQQPYSTVSTPAPQYAQPVAPQGQYVQPPMPQQYTGPPSNQAPQYPTPYNQYQDPINRGATVSPVSTVAYNSAPPAGTAELQTPQSTGAYNPNVSELGSQNTNYDPHASELSSSRDHGYNPNASELGNSK
ncbi:hypothetical protein P154DRAFT_529080 [Amniculicola lignicola CBS 123094]|uniref:MARVEL domain-containing protein n=1 Tax=Amniculicola lignicola CBS 123094 TaxID=1392246 RepID=A0A6A5X3I2_9PLEO|nr:hypothetical protein P154DRAFT_529080 [Amniculicola lignicola CBS 123094]